MAKVEVWTRVRPDNTCQFQIGTRLSDTVPPTVTTWPQSCSSSKSKIIFFNIFVYAILCKSFQIGTRLSDTVPPTVSTWPQPFWAPILGLHFHYAKIWCCSKSAFLSDNIPPTVTTWPQSCSSSNSRTTFSNNFVYIAGFCLYRYLMKIFPKFWPEYSLTMF